MSFNHALVAPVFPLRNLDLENPEDTSDSANADSQTTGLLINLYIGIPVALACLLLFDVVRRWYPSVFETRRKLNEARDPVDYLGNRISTPSAPSYKMFGWLGPTLRLDMETITDTHGLDAALFLRYHLIMFAFFLALLVPSAILLPVYYTGDVKNYKPSQFSPNSSDSRNATVGINKFSISNIPRKDPWRFWVVLLAEYSIGAFVCYFLSYHFSLYCRDRRRYRAARNPANYAILVQDVPSGARSAEAVRNYWERVFPGQIATVYYVHDARRLEKWKDCFWNAVTNRELAEWKLHQFHEKKSRKEEKRSKRALKLEERRARREEGMMAREIQRKQVSHPGRTVLEPEDNVVDIEREAASSSWTNDKISGVSPGAPDQNRLADNAMGDVNDMIDENGEIVPPKAPGVRHRLCGVIPMPDQGPPKKPEAAVQYWELTQRRAWAKVSAYQSRRDEGYFRATNAAIVVFKSRRSAAIAAQTNFSRKEYEWRVSRAPEPNAINWGALCVTGWSIYVRQAITTVLSAAFTIFWVIPVTAIMLIASTSKLSSIEIGGNKPFSFLSKVKDFSPYFIGLVESNLPTVILSVFLGFVPSIFSFFVSISRITSHAERDRLVRDWYFTFVVFSNFLFVAFAGSLLRSMEDILKQPGRSVSILAGNIPKQAAFMMNFILFTTLLEVPRELLQLGRLIGRGFKLKFSAKTQRQREKVDVDGMDMDYVGGYAMSQLVTLLGLVYSTIQPFIIVICVAYFAMTYVVFKYNLCYSFYNEYEDGGRMYGGALYGIWIGLLVHLLTMVGVLGLNKVPVQTVLIIIPTVLSVLFVLHCKKSVSTVLEHGSALETQDHVERLEGCTKDVIEHDLVETYDHPGWEELPNLNELENMNGIVTEEERARDAENDMEDFDSLSGESTTEQGEEAFERDGHIQTQASTDPHLSSSVNIKDLERYDGQDEFHSMPSYPDLSESRGQQDRSPPYYHGDGGT